MHGMKMASLNVQLFLFFVNKTISKVTIYIRPFINILYSYTVENSLYPFDISNLIKDIMRIQSNRYFYNVLQ